MNSALKRTLVVAALAVPALGLTLWPAAAQPGTGTPAAGQPSDKPPAGGPRGDRGQQGGRSEWAEKLRDETRDHPRIGRALIALHEAKDYFEKTKVEGDWGGHKAAAIKSCDDAIKELTEAMKFDPKRPAGPGGPPGDKKPGEAPAPPPPTDKK